jgi:hypothetical protein
MGHTPLLFEWRESVAQRIHCYFVRWNLGHIYTKCHSVTFKQLYWWGRPQVLLRVLFRHKRMSV